MLSLHDYYYKIVALGFGKMLSYLRLQKNIAMYSFISSSMELRSQSN